MAHLAPSTPPPHLYLDLSIPGYLTSVFGCLTPPLGDQADEGGWPLSPHGLTHAAELEGLARSEAFSVLNHRNPQNHSPFQDWGTPSPGVNRRSGFRHTELRSVPAFQPGVSL